MNPPVDQLKRIRDHILLTQAVYKEKQVSHGPLRDDYNSWAFLNRPTLKPLPWPAYVSDPDTLDHENDSEVKFYAACENKDSDMSEIFTFVAEKKPSLSCLQYGLEQASFGGHVEAVRFLLQLRDPIRVPLHNCAFERVVPSPEEYRSSSSTKFRAMIFSKHSQHDLIALLQAFIDDGGWHPDNYWRGYYGESHPIGLQNCISDRSLLMFLLKHGADATRGLKTAIEMWDAEAVDILVDHGAKCPSLHGVVRHMDKLGGHVRYEHFGPPFEPQRRRVAERLLARASEAGLDINGVSYERTIMRMNSSIATGPYPSKADPFLYSKQSTAFSYACEANDWEFAEWLLEHGAEPLVPDRQKTLFFPDEIRTTFSETAIREFVDKVRERSGRDIPDLRYFSRPEYGTSSKRADHAAGDTSGRASASLVERPKPNSS